MAQLVTRVDDRLLAAVDELVKARAVESRSAAVRAALRRLVDDHRRQGIADAIVRGYRDQPQSTVDVTWSDEATMAMIADEPW
jgi:metal-responsive CopG/Arc/MetJ family transcriptional regulator